MELCIPPASRKPDRRTGGAKGFSCSILPDPAGSGREPTRLVTAEELWHGSLWGTKLETGQQYAQAQWVNQTTQYPTNAETPAPSGSTRTRHRVTSAAVERSFFLPPARRYLETGGSRAGARSMHEGKRMRGRLLNSEGVTDTSVILSWNSHGRVLQSCERGEAPRGLAAPSPLGGLLSRTGRKKDSGKLRVLPPL